MPDRVDTTELRKLLEAATPGPWEYINTKPDGAPEWMSTPKFIRAPNAMVKNDRGPDYATEVMSDEDYDAKDTDGFLIVALRNQASDLLDMLEEANTWANGPDDRDQAALTDWQRGYKQAQNDIGKLLALNSAPSPRGGG